MDENLLKLKEKLEEQSWPDVYLFKFIVPNTSELVAKATGLFNQESEISLHSSKNGKYVCVSVKEVMSDVDSIIEKYIQASTIKGLIAL